MEANDKIYVAGHRGLVGSAICRSLKKHGFEHLLTATHAELDLCDQQKVQSFFAEHRPDVVVLAAAKVGGIYANSTYPAEFVYQNLQIQNNVIDSAYRNGCKKFLFLGSSCIYPKLCPQPIKEEYLLTGPLEPTNEAYALAKIAGIKMCQAYRKQYGFDAISVMPTNLYGIGDNYHPQNSHVIPALIRRFHEAKVNCDSEVVIWGSGKPLREFLHADDLADACVFLLQNFSDYEHINIGTQKECTISSLAQMIAEIVGFKGQIVQDLDKPDGTLRKLLDCSRIFGLGWSPEIGLREGLERTYQDFLKKLC